MAEALPNDLVHAMEDHGIPPHSNRHGVIAKCEAERADKQPCRLREDPNAQHAEHVDKVA